MSVTYKGDSSWLQAHEPEQSGQGNEPETITDTWIGATSGLAAFLAAHPMRSAYLGGYITRRSPKDHTPGPGVSTVELTIMLPPPYDVVASPTTFSTRSISISGYLANNVINTRYFNYRLKRETTYSSPTARYKYFAGSQPSGPTHSSAGGDIVILKDVITVICYGNNPDGTGDGWVQLETYVMNPSQIHADLKAEVILTPLTKSIVEGEPIEGTPYWRCTDTCTADYKNDGDA